MLRKVSTGMFPSLTERIKINKRFLTPDVSLVSGRHVGVSDGL